MIGCLRERVGNDSALPLLLCHTVFVFRSLIFCDLKLSRFDDFCLTSLADRTRCERDRMHHQVGTGTCRVLAWRLGNPP
jgi:hypothetical protein